MKGCSPADVATFVTQCLMSRLTEPRELRMNRSTAFRIARDASIEGAIPGGTLSMLYGIPVRIVDHMEDGAVDGVFALPQSKEWDKLPDPYQVEWPRIDDSVTRWLP